jgi:hypothetical protein
MGFRKTAAVKSIPPTTKSFVAFLACVFRKLCSEVFIITVTENYVTITDTTPNLGTVHGNDIHIDYTKLFHGIY